MLFTCFQLFHYECLQIYFAICQSTSKSSKTEHLRCNQNTSKHNKRTPYTTNTQPPTIPTICDHSPGISCWLTWGDLESLRLEGLHHALFIPGGDYRHTGGPPLHGLLTLRHRTRVRRKSEGSHCSDSRVSFSGFARKIAATTLNWTAIFAFSDVTRKSCVRMFESIFYATSVLLTYYDDELMRNCG